MSTAVAALLLSLSALAGPARPVGLVDLGGGRFGASAPGRALRIDAAGMEWTLSTPRAPRAGARIEGDPPRRLGLRWDAAPGARARGGPRVDGVVHLLLGADPAEWRIARPHHRTVRIDDVRPGVSIDVAERGGVVELAPRVDATASIRALTVRFGGADRVAVGDGAVTVVHVGPHRVALAAPRAMLESRDGRTRAVPCRAERCGPDGVTWRWSPRSPPSPPPPPAAAGPELRVAAFLGGSAGGVADAVDVPAVAVDDGPGGPRSVVVGSTASLDFPATRGAFDGVHGRAAGGAFDAFVLCVGPDGALEWATFLGGAADDLGYGAAVGPNGEVAVTGATVSRDFPVTPTAFDRTSNGWAASCVVASEAPYDAFVTVLSPDGAAVTYSTYLGGSLVDAGTAVAVEADGRVQVGGITLQNPGAEDLPVTADALQRSYAGTDCTQSDGFVARIDPAAAGAASLVHCTYLGGPAQDAVRALRLDRFGRTFVALETNSAVMPVTPGAFQPVNAGPNGDGYVARLDLERPGVAGLEFGTFFGGSKIDMALGVAPTGAGTVWVTGVTTAAGAGAGTPFPTTASALDATLGGAADAFLVHVDSRGRSLLAATLLGGSGPEHGRAVGLDRHGAVVVAGETGSPDFPATGDAFQSGAAGGADAFVARVAPDGATLLHATRVGGSHDDLATGVAVDAAGTAHVVGTTLSPDFPAAPGSSLGGASDPFLIRLQPGASGACAVDAWPAGGAAVALAPDVAAVGAPDAAAGSVSVWRRAAGGWTLGATLARAGGAEGDGFGAAVALAPGGERVVAGAARALGGRGAAAGFDAAGGTWIGSSIVAADGAPGDRFGAAVDGWGSFVVVGAPHADVGGVTDAGAAHVFARVGPAWVEVAKLVRRSPAPDDRFGTVVAIDGGRIAVGAPGVDVAAPDGGAVLLFRAGPGGRWSPDGRVIPGDAAGGDAFGSAAALDGRWLVAGTPGRDGAHGAEDAGAASVFLLAAGGPIESARLALDVRAPGDRFGAAVALDGDRIVVGAPGDHGGAPAAGSVSVFARDEGGWRAAGRLGAAAVAGDGSGTAVAVSSRTALAGAPHAASGAGRVDVFTLADRISTYGVGCPGAGGGVPTLAAVGCPGPGGAVSLHLAGGAPGAAAVVLLGTGRAEVPVFAGCALLLSGVLPARLGPFPLDASGAATLAGVVPPGAPEGAVTMQAFLADPSAASGGSATNGVEMVLE